jgi:hypothetical protein
VVKCLSDGCHDELLDSVSCGETSILRLVNFFGHLCIGIILGLESRLMWDYPGIILVLESRLRWDYPGVIPRFEHRLRY